MKKLYIFALSLIVLAGCFTGCKAQEKPLEMLVYGYTEAVPEIRPLIEYDRWSTANYTDEKMYARGKITFFGKNYVGNYSKSRLTTGTSETRHTYDLGDNKFFNVDENGKLISIFLGRGGEGAAKTREECDEIALKALKELDVSDLSAYEKTVSFDEKLKIYVIEYRKYLGTVPTEDSATVTVEENGNIFRVELNMFGKIALDKVPTIDTDAAEAAVKAKLDKLTSSAKIKYDTVEYDHTPFTVSKADSDKYVLLTTVSVSCKTGDDPATVKKILLVAELN